MKTWSHLFLFLGLFGAAGAAELELLRDPRFLAGFRTIAPTSGQRTVLGHLAGEQGDFPPAWDLDQWHSRSPFTNPPATKAPGQLIFTNAAKWVVISNGFLTLGVDSRNEYANSLRKSASEPWVHLLAEQAITNCPSLDQLKSLTLRFTARLVESETFKPAGYTPDLHAAQF